jgi:hypothetical protein
MSEILVFEEVHGYANCLRCGCSTKGASAEGLRILGSCNHNPLLSRIKLVFMKRKSVFISFLELFHYRFLELFHCRFFLELFHYRFFRTFSLASFSNFFTIVFSNFFTRFFLELFHHRFFLELFNLSFFSRTFSLASFSNFSIVFFSNFLVHLHVMNTNPDMSHSYGNERQGALGSLLGALEFFGKF